MSRFESIPKAARIGLPVALAAGSFLGYNAVADSNGNEDPRLELPANTAEEVCEADGLSPDAYLEAIGLGPFRTNEAFDTNENDREAVVTEVVTDISRNTMGIALLSEALKQQSSDYTVEQFLGRVTDTYEELEANDERRQEVCETVVGHLETATLESIKAPTLLEVTNNYTDEVLTGVQGTEVNSQAEHAVVTVKDENGAVRFGIALQEDRDGKFLLILNNGDATGDAGETVDDGTTGEQQDVSTTATTIAEIGGGTTRTETTSGGGGTSGSDGGGETTGGAPGGDGPGCDGVGTGCEGEGPGGPGGPGEGEDDGPTPTTSQPPRTTTTTSPPTTQPPTTTTTRPPTTTTTQPPTTTTTQPKGEEPGPDCANNPFDPRC